MLEDRLVLKPFEEEALRPEIIRTALFQGEETQEGSGIASRYTAFVAVEETTTVGGERVTVVQGNAVDPQTLEEAGIHSAVKLLIAIPEGFEAGAIVERARALNPAIRVIARAHSDAEVQHLEKLNVAHVVMGEREIAARMLDLAARDPSLETDASPAT